MIDIERFLQTLIIYDNNLAVKRKGVGVVENILMARALMYSSLIPDAEPFAFFKMTDAELINELKKRGSFQRKIVTCLKYRRLFKQAYAASPAQLDKQRIDIAKSLEEPKTRRVKEREIEEDLNIPPGHIIIDVPDRELHQAEPRIHQTDIMIVDENKMK